MKLICIKKGNKYIHEPFGDYLLRMEVQARKKRIRDFFPFRVPACFINILATSFKLSLDGQKRIQKAKENGYG